MSKKYSNLDRGIYGLIFGLGPWRNVGNTQTGGSISTATLIAAIFIAIIIAAVFILLCFILKPV